MSGIKKFIQNIAKVAIPRATKAPIIVPTPEKTRKYKDVEQLVPRPGEFVEQNYISLTSISLESPKDEEEFVLLDLITRECVLLICGYYNYLSEYTAELHNQPGFIDKIEELKLLVELDKPVKKKLLHETCPELFVYEIMNKESPIPLEEKYKNLGLPPKQKQNLVEEEKNLDEASSSSLTIHNKPIEQTKIARVSPPKVPIPERPTQRIGSFNVWDKEDPGFQKLISTEHYSIYEMYERKEYIWNQIKKTYMGLAPLLRSYSEKLGNIDSAIKFLRLKGDKRTPEENKIFEGIDYINRLIDEHKEYCDDYRETMTKNIMLPFPMPEWLIERYTDDLGTLIKEKIVAKDMWNKMVGIPDNTEKWLKNKEMMEQKARDAVILDERDRKEALKVISAGKGDEFLVRRDLSTKDEQLIRKMNVLSEQTAIQAAENKKEFRRRSSKQDDPYRKIDDLRAHEEADITIDALIKMIYLNNADPTTYDLEFWAEYYNIRPQNLKNIFYHISYPVLGEKQPVGLLTFIEVPRKKEIFDLFQEHQKREMKKGGNK